MRKKSERLPGRPLTVRTRSLTVALVLVAAACAPFRYDAEPIPAPGPTTAPISTTTTTVPESAAPTEAAQACTAGSASLGDSYYPELGNGGYDVEHVDLDLDFTALPSGAFTGIATMAIRGAGDRCSIVIDTGQLDIVGAQTVVGGVATNAPIAPESATETRVELGGGIDDFVLVLNYEGRPEAYMSVAIPIPVGLRAAGDGWFAVSEPYGATTWFPANDHPLDKATYTVALTVPEGLTGVSGGVLVSEESVGEGDRFVWELRQPVASYLVPLAVGDFERREQGDVSGVVIRDYVDRDIPASALTDLGSTGEILEWMVGLFGPYPFDAYGTLAVDALLGGALETQTLATHDRAATGETVIVHELAHQWIGNSVSLSDWSDVWLNEGFATYAQWLWDEEQLGAGAYEQASREGFEAYLTLPVPGAPPRTDLFNGGIYVGGATVLHALRVEMGDEAFFEMTLAWAQENAYGNVTTQDFVETAERFAERDLQAFFDQWLFRLDGVAYAPLE